MLFSVLGSSPLHGSRGVARCFRIALFGVASLGALLPASRALAQEADDSGWFDAPATEQTPEPYYAEPATDAAPAPAQQQDVPDTDPSALTTFRPALDPYGAWVSDSTYGTVWVPNRATVGADFAPYVSRGHWALTADDDWIWESDYPFGWAVFHYGRWVWIPSYGWSWVPGRRYANAWVVWRVPSAEYAYVGWAPMPPTWGWYNGFAFGVWYSPPLPYVFCPSAYVFDYRVHYHIVHDRRLVGDIASHSRVYPTPYRAPAQPSIRTAGAPGVRPPPISQASAPRGPAMSAARVPPQAMPAVRTRPSPNATRLSGSRIISSDFSRERMPASDPRLRTAPRVPYDVRRTYSGEPVRRSAPSSPAWNYAPRPSAPDRVRVEPRSVAPVRTAPVRSYAPSPARNYAPSSHSFAPASHSFAPSMPRMHSGGGSFHRR